MLEKYPGKKAFLLGNEALRAELTGMGVAIDDEASMATIVRFLKSLGHKTLAYIEQLEAEREGKSHE